MSDNAEPVSAWAEKRAAGKARRAQKIRQRETYFDLVVSGYSVDQVAGAMNMSASAARRSIDQALAERRFDATEHFAKVQFARLNKALRCADIPLEDGKVQAVASFLRVVREMNRLYRLAAGSEQLTSPAAAALAFGRNAPLALAAPGLETADGTLPESRVKEIITP